MRLHWPGVYGLGVVLSTLGAIWQPQHTREFILSGILMALAAFIGMSVRRDDEPSIQRSGALEPLSPRAEVIYKTGEEQE